MGERYSWKETKRRANLVKHGPDFIDADLVLGNRYRLEINNPRNNEKRKQVFAHVFDVLARLWWVYGRGTCLAFAASSPGNLSVNYFNYLPLN
jgi:uncharacterized DUF497 family protein